MSFLRRAIKRWLYRHSMSVSQSGQDWWVMGEVFNFRRRGYFVDIGAHDGLEISNTFLLERKLGWDGLCIEANPATFGFLRENRRCRCLNVCLDHQVGEVSFRLRGAFGGIAGSEAGDEGRGTTVVMPTRTLHSVLAENGAPSVIDYLTIDVEGAEERVLLGFPHDEYTFRCMTVERPTPRLKAELADNGYVLIAEAGELDAYYVHRTFVKQYKANKTVFRRKKFFAIRWR